MKSQTFFVAAVLALLLPCADLAAQAVSDAPQIEIVYPRPDQRIAAVDSQFIFGKVTPGAALRINGDSVKVHDNGAFLAFLPVYPGRFVFKLEARLQQRSTASELAINVPEPYRVPPKDSLLIRSGYMQPSGMLILTEGDLLEVGFRGTPELHAYFRTSRDARLMPMLESAPRPQNYWAESLFGAGGVPDSLLVKGLFAGQLSLTERHVDDSVTITFYLCRKRLRFLDSEQKGFRRQLDSCQCVARDNDNKLTVWPETKYVVGELTDSTQTLRVGSRQGYFSIFQPRGLRFRITGFEDRFYRGRLVDGQEVWIADTSLRLLPEGARVPRGSFGIIRTTKIVGGVEVTVDPGAQLPFRVDHDPASRRLILDLYNCTSDVDWVRYDNSDSLIAAIRFEQPQVGVTRVIVELAQSLWGYDASYAGTKLKLRLAARPPLTGNLRGLRIVLDPGHSPDAGAIGPTGFKEKDANLLIALELRDLLIDAGAEVFMTRAADTPLPLHARPPLAYQFDADIFISVHNNALPDGVNPFFNNGSSCFYYHPHSQALAASVLKRLVKATGYNDYGLWHGNFAVIRPTGYLAILVECAFMMLPEQERDLLEPEFRKKIAAAICDGVKDFVEVERDRARSGM